MGNKKIKVLAIAFISIQALTTGCGITITRNYHYSYPNERIEKANKSKEKINDYTDTLTNNRNEQI